MLKIPPVIEDQIKAVVVRMQNDADLDGVWDFIETISPGTTTGAPYFLFGHREEINQRLVEKDSDSVYKYQKYPCVALRLDVPEKVENGLWKYTLNIALLMFTDKNYDADQRKENVFKPILYPLYACLMKQIRQCGLFTWPDFQAYPEHTKLDRYYWGTPAAEGNVKNIFIDPIDAIELIDLKINSRIKC